MYQNVVLIIELLWLKNGAVLCYTDETRCSWFYETNIFNHDAYKNICPFVEELKHRLNKLGGISVIEIVPEVLWRTNEGIYLDYRMCQQLISEMCGNLYLP
jgi:hypothetical protein